MGFIFFMPVSHKWVIVILLLSALELLYLLISNRKKMTF